ncbi:concanavalin A-like lectin/glucanase domain-containing protein [Xylariales sp. AK1849]|nr:concanavalin A-like lectin/glucanase domain-containing protein [Xylariales sp. AK1849]
MSYALSTHYVGQSLLEGFSFFTGLDKSDGFVNYQDYTSAVSQGLVAIGDRNNVKLSVDAQNTFTVNDVGRPSVRLTSYKGFTHGLFIADFEHMPSSTCGTWPAFWAFNNANNGINYPLGGEVDIVEGVHTTQRNLFAAHTPEGCTAPASGFSGQQGATDCGPTPDRVGCTYAAPITDTTSFGDSFNAAGGGVYAMEWESDGIKLWHWARGNIPNDINYAPLLTPSPVTWGPPQAIFGGSTCDTDTFFFNMSLVIDIDFCGDYGDAFWTAQCGNLAPTCREYVARNPQAYLGSFWDINYIDVYQKAADDTIGNSTNTASLPPFPTNTNVPLQMNTTIPFPTNTTAPASLLVLSSTRTVTLSTVLPTPTLSGTGLSDPLTIDGYTLLGCFGSLSGYPSFEPIADLLAMDNEVCVASCREAGKKFTGTFETTCYCADSLGDAYATDNDRCDYACPGNRIEACGGLLDGPNDPGSNMTIPGANMTIPGANSTGPSNITLLLARTHHNRRAAPASILLTVYGDISADLPPPPAPGLGGPNPGPGATIMPSATITTNTTITTAVTVTYTTICATNPASLIVLQYCTTLTLEDCPCTQTPAAALVPMQTYPQACDACGPKGESTVTLTVPAVVVTGGPEIVVTAVAVVTVIPVLPVNGSFVNGSFVNANGSTAGQPPVIGGVTKGNLANPKGAVAGKMPVIAGANKDGMGIGAVIAYGILAWLGLFGVMILL